jgi:uncharacterized RDD family membrane protein YckC
MASSAAAPTATAASIAATVSASVAATAIALARAVATGARWIVLRGIVVGRKILWRGSVGFRLAVLRSVTVSQVLRRGLSFFVMILVMLTLGNVRFFVRGMLFDGRLFGMKLFVMRFVVMLAGARQAFARQNFNRSAAHGRQRRHG